MPDLEKVKYDIERCICHVPDACRDCSHYGHGEAIGCMEELLADALTLLKEQEDLGTELTNAVELIHKKNERIEKLLKEMGIVVRCKDCKHGEKSPTFKYYPDVTWCNEYSTSHNDDWFCADGERKS